MVQYTLAQKPELILTVAGKDSPKARDKAMAELVSLMDKGELDTELAAGFSPDQLIPVSDRPIPTGDQITQAGQVLSSLALLKAKVQEMRSEALKVRQKVDLLFSDAPLHPEDLSTLQEGFKLLKNFAQINARYQSARVQAETERQILDQALQQESAP